MFVSCRRAASSLLAFLALLWLAGGSVSLSAQGTLGVAEAFVRTAYDELLDDKLNLTIVLAPMSVGNTVPWGNLPDVVVSLDEPKVDRGVSDSGDLNVLRVHLGVSVDGTLTRARSTGWFVKTRQLDEMVQFASQHPKWSDSALVNELARRGAAYPGEAGKFQAGLRLERLEPFVGRIMNREVAFDIRAPSPRQDLPDDFSFEWVVELRTEPTPGQSTRVVLRFEPFSGRLLSLSRSLR
jgi:hypothetical protein